MSMIAGKPPGFFGRKVDLCRLARFLRYGLPLDPELPGPVEWSAALGEEIGEVILTVTAVPDELDAVRYGDGAGVLLDLEWSYGEEDIGLGSILPGVFEVTVPAELHGTTVPLRLWARSSVGAGPSVTILLAIPGEPGGPTTPENAYIDAFGVFYIDESGVFYVHDGS